MQYFELRIPSLGTRKCFWKELSSVIFFFLPWSRSTGMTWGRGYLQAGIMDPISPQSKLTQKSWASSLPLGCCTCGWTTGHILSCRRLHHKVDLAFSFEDINVLKNLRLNWVAYQQQVVWISHFGTKYKITGISSNCIIRVHIELYLRKVQLRMVSKYVWWMWLKLRDQLFIS